MHSKGRVVILTVLVLVGTAGLATAHETVTVNGYELTFGGADEPVITGERMWLQVEILDADSGESVDGIEESVGIAVQRPFGTDRFELDVSGVHGRPGWYEGAVVFTEPGTYTIFITLDDDGETIETSFQKQVHNASNLHYPASTPPPGQDDDMSAAAGFGLGVVVAAIGLAGAFVIGRRTSR